MIVIHSEAFQNKTKTCNTSRRGLKQFYSIKYFFIFVVLLLSILMLLFSIHLSQRLLDIAPNTAIKGSQTQNKQISYNAI